MPVSTRKGRPRSRWIDQVDRDAGRVGISDWKRKAQDREG